MSENAGVRRVRVYSERLGETVLVAVGGAVALFLVIWFGIVGGATLPLTVSLIFVSGVVFTVCLISLIVFAFVDAHRVTCDATGCEVATTKLFRTRQTQSFTWSDVSRIEVTEEPVGHGRYQSDAVHVYAYVRGRRIELLREHRFTRDFRDLLMTIAERAAHLPHVWLHAKECGDQRAIASVASYRKVRRPRRF